ncbi:MAG: hypothetical protein DRN06_06035 [Thermoprotei archaeon]|nr:MAG: hypothetical protein DRN06_06035 [Thermoprotei archaeon]
MGGRRAGRGLKQYTASRARPQGPIYLGNVTRKLRIEAGREWGPEGPKVREVVRANSALEGSLASPSSFLGACLRGGGSWAGGLREG